MIRSSKFLLLACLSFGFCSLPLQSSNACAQIAQESYNIASGYYSRGDWDAAIEEFQRVIKHYPNTEQSVAAHFFVGEAMMQNGDFAGSYHAFQGFLTQSPKHRFSPRATFRLGEAAYRLKQYSQAVRLLETFVLENPSESLNEFALAYLGELRLRNREPQLAQKAYETALRNFPNGTLHEKCRLGLAKAFQMQGSNDLAARIFKSIVDDPSSTLVAEAQLQMGIMSVGNEEFELAQQLLSEALANCGTDESKAEAAYWLARTETSLQNPESAVQAFEEALNLAQSDSLVSSILFDGSLAAIQCEKFEIADQWLGELHNRWPQGTLADDALHLRIDLAQRQYQTSKVAELVYQFIETYPNSEWIPKVQELHGRVQYQDSEHDDSLSTFKNLLDSKYGRTVDAASSRESWKYMLGLNLIALKRLQEAETVLRSVKLDEATDRFRALVEMARATTFSGLEKFAQAIPGYENYLALNPAGDEASRARAELTIAFCKTKQWKRASLAFEELRSNHHDERRLVLETAQFLAESANADIEKDYAAEWYELLATEGNPEEFVARGLSGLAWLKMKNNDDRGALEAFDRLLETNPESEFSPEARMARAKSLEDSKDFEGAARSYENVLVKYPQSRFVPAAMLRAAYSYEKVGGIENLKRAQKLLSDYLELPGNPPAKDEAIYQLGWIFHDLNLTDRGFAKFEALVKEYPNSKYAADATYRLLQHRVEQKDSVGAQALVEKLLVPETPPEILSRVIFLQGQLAAERDEWSAVTESMRELSSRTDDRILYAKSNYWLAESLYRQEEYVEAGDLFQRLLEKIKDLDESLAPWIHLRASQCQAHSESWARALLLAESAKVEFQDFEVRYEFDFVRGRALAAQGKFDDAIDAFQRVLDSKNSSSTETAAISQWRIGECYFHQEKFAEAIDAYYRVDSQFEFLQWRAASIMQAAKCQEHLGNWKHAAKLYKQLISQFPKSEFRNAAEERLSFSLRQADAKEKLGAGTTKR